MIPEPPQSDAVRTHLRQARYHLDLACALLDRPNPEFRAAAAHVAGCYYEALAAVTTWHRVSLPVEADVQEHARHAVHFASILRTPVHRALVALPTLRSVGRKARLDVHHREEIETGWYTARNLYQIVQGELPTYVRGSHAAAAPPVVPAKRTRPGERKEASSRRSPCCSPTPPTQRRAEEPPATAWTPRSGRSAAYTTGTA